MSKKVQNFDEDVFWAAEYIARKSYKKSKFPYCDFVGGWISDICKVKEDDDIPILHLDDARQLEYNWRYYEKMADRQAKLLKDLMDNTMLNSIITKEQRKRIVEAIKDRYPKWDIEEDTEK